MNISRNLSLFFVDWALSHIAPSMTMKTFEGLVDRKMSEIEMLYISLLAFPDRTPSVSELNKWIENA